eukprot:jgi/Botrbrau1/9780/Bobra.85_1s0024.1
MYKPPPQVVGSTLVQDKSLGGSFIPLNCITCLDCRRVQRCWRKISGSRIFDLRPPKVGISLAWRLRAYEDPLQDALYNTWGEASEDWGVEEYTDEQLIDILYEDDNTPEGIFQNILAITLTFLLAIAAGLTLLRLTLVVWTLIAAAVRYTVIAVLILFLFIFFLP